MPTLTELLQQLEAAVRTGDQPRALDLASQIQQQLVRETYDRAAIERRLRELLGQIEQRALSASQTRPGASKHGGAAFGSDIRCMPRRLHYPQPFEPEKGHTFPEGSEGWEDERNGVNP